MRIVPFDIESYEEVYALWMGCRNMGFNDVDDSREGIERLVCGNPRTCFLAEEAGRVIGTVLAGNDGRRGYVYHLCVAEAYRRRGIARALMDAMPEGISKVAPVAFAYNEDANAFYERIGFTERKDLVYRNLGKRCLIRRQPARCNGDLVKSTISQGQFRRRRNRVIDFNDPPLRYLLLADSLTYLRGGCFAVFGKASRFATASIGSKIRWMRLACEICNCI